MKNNHGKIGNARKAISFTMLCCLLIPTRLIYADGVPQSDIQASAHQIVRDLDMKIKVMPKSKTIQLITTNHSPEGRFLRIRLDFTLFRINLTDENGKPLKMTPKGVEDLTEPAIGSVKLIELKIGESQNTSIDLAPLFEFPQKGIIRCEVSRLVHFANSQKGPSEKEWVKFPPVSIMIGDAVSAKN